MDIIVTGGAGFIGSHLVEHLLAKGHGVYVIDDLSTGKLEFLQSVIHHPRMTFLHDSASNGKLLSGLLERCEAIYHLAAVLGVKNTVKDPIKVIDGNIESTRIVLEAAYQKKRKVIFASTSEVYGKNRDMPFHENSDRVLGTPSIHRWCYATAKALDEHLCFAYADKGLPVTVLRYFNTYGPRQTSSQYGGVVPRFIRAALKDKALNVFGDGRQTRCFTFVRDTVTATAAALDAKANGLAFNIGADSPVPIGDLAVMIKKLAGSSSPIRFIPYEEAYGKSFEDVPARIPDITRAKRVLGFSSSVALEEGLRLTLQWYKSRL